MAHRVHASSPNPNPAASSLGIHTNTVVQFKTNIWPRRMVGPTRDNIHATVGSITGTHTISNYFLFSDAGTQSEENH